MSRRHCKTTAALAIASFGFVACSGGGGSSGAGGVLQAPPTPASAPTPAKVTSQSVNGLLLSVPQGAFGPGSGTAALAGATVIIGPALVQGATPPPTIPDYDVKTITSAAGSFIATVPVLPAAPPITTFVLPYNNVFHVTDPATGYFVNIFPQGGDGKSVGAQIPVHAFVPVGPGGALGTFRSTTASSDEAGWLAQVNLDRAAKGLAPVAFDESAEEAAREEVSNLTTNQDDCHYDTQNRGPDTRYALLGGLGANDEAIGIYGGSPTSITSYWEQLEQAFVSEGPGGYHYDDILGAAAIWSGIAVGTSPFPAGGPGGTFYAGDVENINIQSTVAFVAGTDGNSCPPNITANNS